MTSSRIFSLKSDVLLCFLVLLFGLEAEPSPVLDALKGQVGGDFQYKHYSKEGEILWLIEGQQPTFNEAMEVTILKPRLIIAQASGNALLTSEKATYDTLSKHCSLMGNVIVDNFSNAYFRGGHLKVILEDHSLSFSSPFEARQGPLSLSAVKGQFNAEEQVFETTGPTRVEYFP